VNSKQRIITALRKGVPDRVPLVNIFNLSLLGKKLQPREKIIDRYIEDPLGSIISFQEKLGHDPVINLYTMQEPELIYWPQVVFPYPEEELSDWQVKEVVLSTDDGKQTIIRKVITPKKIIESIICHESCQNWVIQHPLRNLDDWELLEYRPDPTKIDISRISSLAKKVKDRAFILIGVPGVWHEAAGLRGTPQFMLDCFDQKDTVFKFLMFLKEHTIRIIDRISTSGIDGILLNESAVGIGISPEMFREFVLPFDQEIVDSAKRKGLLVSYHICGKCNTFLELMVDTGADAIETLTMRENGGDVQLADAKKRIGDKVALWGGFQERVLLPERKPNDVECEVIRCLKAAAKGGGYVLRGTGQVYAYKESNITVLRDTLEKYGRYYW